MPKRNECDIPTLKIGTNGDYFCYAGGKKVYLGRNQTDAKKNFVLFLENQRTKVPSAKPVVPTEGTLVQELILNSLTAQAHHRDISKIRHVMKILNEMYGGVQAIQFGQVNFYVGSWCDNQIGSASFF